MFNTQRHLILWRKHNVMQNYSFFFKYSRPKCVETSWNFVNFRKGFRPCHFWLNKLFFTFYFWNKKPNRITVHYFALVISWSFDSKFSSTGDLFCTDSNWKSSFLLFSFTLTGTEHFTTTVTSARKLRVITVSTVNLFTFRSKLFVDQRNSAKFAQEALWNIFCD